MQEDPSRAGAAGQPASGAHIGTVAAVALPLLFFIAALPGFSYWGEPGRLLASGATLQHGRSPIMTLLSHGLMRLPLGPLAIRNGLAVALCAAVTAGALFAALRHGLQRLGVAREGLRVAAAFGSTCVALSLPPVWNTVITGNPHWAGVALCALLLHQLLRALPEPPRLHHDHGALALGGLYLGLLTSHDPGFGLVATGAWLLSLRGVARWPRATLVAAALGLCPLALPALHGREGSPLPDDGEVLTRLGTLPQSPLELAGPALLLLIAAVGTLGMLRSPRHRDAALLWLSGLCPPALAALWLRPDPTTQSAAIALACVAVMALATLGFGLLVAGAARTERLGTVLAIGWVALGAMQLREASMTRGLASFDTSAVLQRHAAEHLPPRAVVLYPAARGHAEAVGFAVEHGARPDVMSVPLARARDPRVSEAIARRTPILRDLLRNLLLRGHLGTAQLQSLSTLVPVALDLPETELPRLGDTLLPDGALLHVIADGTARRDRLLAADAQREYYGRVYAGVDVDRLDARSRAILLRLHRRDALYYMRGGERDAARDALSRMAALAPQDAALAALRAAVGEPDDEDGEGPVDIEPLVAPPG